MSGTPQEDRQVRGKHRWRHLETVFRRPQIAGIFQYGIGIKTRNPGVMTGTSLLPFYSADATTMLARALLVLQR